MSEQAYCSGKNTGCDHEDKPTIKECSDCPYMTTIRPMSEQDELLLPNVIRIIRENYGRIFCLDGKEKAEKVAPEILAKAKQHYEGELQQETLNYYRQREKRLDRPELKQEMIDRGEKCYEPNPYCDRGCHRFKLLEFIDRILAIIPEEANALREIITYLETKVKEAKKQGCDETIQRVIGMPHATTHCDIIKTLKGVTDDKA